MTAGHKSVGPSNPGMPLDMAWVNTANVNLPALIRRAATHKTRRSVKKMHQAAWLLRAAQCMDLTTLAGDDTDVNVNRLCAKAKAPIRKDLLMAMGVTTPITTGAVCVYPNLVPIAAKALAGSGIPIASVATGFPSGQTPLPQRLEEIKYAIKEGATEIDIVIQRAAVLKGDWEALYADVKACKEACGPDIHMKTILAIGECGTMTNVLKASLESMMAGSDFIKTSTGKEGVNATFEVALVMIRAIRDYHDTTGFRVGFKPAGGIRSAKDTLSWFALMKEELGDEWTQPSLFRLGASALVTDIERQLYHYVHGAYAAADRFSMP